MNRTWLLGNALLALGATSASAAEIDPVDIFKGVGDPNTNTYLSMFFGKLFDAGAKDTLFSLLIGNFNLLFFALGLALLSYNMVIAVTSTANDGQVFGRNASALWAPVRCIVAVALLIPLPTSYNASQHLVAHMTNAGTAAASFFWSETADAIIDQRLNLGAVDNRSKDEQLIGDIWRLEFCRSAFNHEVAKAGGNIIPVTRRVTEINKAPAISYDAADPAACGLIVTPSNSRAIERLTNRAGRGTYDEYADSLRTILEGVATSIGQATDDIVAKASAREPQSFRELTPELEAWKAGHAASLEKLFGGLDLSDDLKEDVVDGVDYRFAPLGLTESPDVTISNSMKNAGWINAGFYYQIVARISSDTSSVIGNLPVVSYGNLISASGDSSGAGLNQLMRGSGGFLWGLFSDEEDDAQELLQEIQGTYAAGLLWLDQMAQSGGLRNVSLNRRVLGDQVSEAEAYMPTATDLSSSIEILNPSTANQFDPLVSLIALGQTLITLSAAAIAGLSAVSSVPFVGGGAETLAGLIGWMVSGVGVLGSTIAFVLPLIPTVVWVLAIASFLISVVVAVFAAPLWAVSHLTLEGEGLGGRSARRGYMMLLSLLLTPTLMVLGLMAGMTLFRIVGTLMNGGIYLALSGSQALGGGALGVSWWFGIFAMLVLVIATYMVVIERSFSLIMGLPQAVLSVVDGWLGGVDGVNSDTARVQGHSSANANHSLTGAMTGSSRIGHGAGRAGAYVGNKALAGARAARNRLSGPAKP